MSESAWELCEDCDGTGYGPDDWYCPFCHGEGWREDDPTWDDLAALAGEEQT